MYTQGVYLHTTMNLQKEFQNGLRLRYLPFLKYAQIQESLRPNDKMYLQLFTTIVPLPQPDRKTCHIKTAFAPLCEWN